MMFQCTVRMDRRIVSLLLVLAAMSCVEASAIGVNYGTVANNLPAPADVAALLQTTYIQKVRLYSADYFILTAFANTGIQIVVGVTNDEIPALGASPSYAQQWVTTNVASYYPSTDIIVIAVGNEVVTTSPNMSTYLVPAIQNLHTGLQNLGLDDKIKVSTAHSFGVLTQSYPASAGAFRTDLSGPVFVPLLEFLSQTGAPFMINAYPYFGYRDNPDIPIAYALFEDGTGVVDDDTGLHYYNMFDAQVDAVYAALAKLGHQDLQVTISETGWPSFGDPAEIGVSISNAQTYNANLVKHLTSNGGTPSRPGVPIDTYIFSLFNENLKPGPTSERNFGLFTPDKVAVYNVGLMTGSNASSPAPAVLTPPPSSSPPEPAATASPPPPDSSSASPPPPDTTSSPPAFSPSSPPTSAPPPPYPVPHSPPSGGNPPPPSPANQTPDSPPTPAADSPADSPIPSSPAATSPATSPVPSAPARASAAGPPSTWCVAKPGASASDLQAALDYACGEGAADCTAIQAGQSCFTPNTLFSHCSYAFDSYYAANGRNYWNCYFGNVSLITVTNPSYSGCTYP